MTEQIMRENLFVIAQTFATERELALTTVSKKIHGNQNFLDKYIRGEISTTLRIYFLMIERLRAEWPAGLEWPETREIPRPLRTPYRPLVNPPPRGSAGRFLGKKVHKRVRAA